MKVSNTGINNISQSLGQSETNKTSKAKSSEDSFDKVSIGKDAKSVEGSDRLQLSERAQQLSRAKEIASDNSIDEAKVARLQKMIDEGKYNVDASAIADRLVDEHILMPE